LWVDGRARFVPRFRAGWWRPSLLLDEDAGGPYVAFLDKRRQHRLADEFDEHFDKRKVELVPAATATAPPASTNTPASGARCSTSPPTMLGRLDELEPTSSPPRPDRRHQPTPPSMAGRSAHRSAALERPSLGGTTQ
jgi:hypothetical protein